MGSIFVILAEGFEETEALTVVDLLRRAGLDVKMAGLKNGTVAMGAHGIGVVLDLSVDDIALEETQALILPGGMPGTKFLGSDKRLAGLLKKADEHSIPIGAICAAPSVLGDLELLNGKKAVCYPGFEKHLKGAEVLTVPVVTDGHITTSRGMGTAIAFGLELIRCLLNQEAADRIRDAILYEI